MGFRPLRHDHQLPHSFLRTIWSPSEKLCFPLGSVICLIVLSSVIFLCRDAGFWASSMRFVIVLVRLGQTSGIMQSLRHSATLPVFFSLMFATSRPRSDVFFLIPPLSRQKATCFSEFVLEFFSTRLCTPALASHKKYSFVVRERLLPFPPLRVFPSGPSLKPGDERSVPPLLGFWICASQISAVPPRGILSPESCLHARHPPPYGRTTSYSLSGARAQNVLFFPG